MNNGSITTVPEARVHVESPFFTGWINATVMSEPISEVIIGNIEGVKSSCFMEATTQTSAAAVTRQPLPVISEPVERVAVGLVGPINPRASDGSKYILTLIDSSTRWAEAVPLKNIEAVTVAEAMLEIFCRTGIPKQVLSDRGSQFISTMMEEVFHLLLVKGIRTSSYHPSCNELCERFNGTLKKMAAEQPKEWPCYVAPLLFAYREVPQSSLKFSPFELLYGRTVRGPLHILRELWDDEQPDPEVQTTYASLTVFKLHVSWPYKSSSTPSTLRRATMRKTKLRQLNVGDKCLVLLLTVHNKLLAQYKSPYDIIQRVSDYNYIIQAAFSAKKFRLLNDFTNTKDELQNLESGTDSESEDEDHEQGLADHEVRVKQF
ncbi:protein NYNRIN-like [Homarus americanus]|uniref:protein NYNRIN-like n=1 Tax=Homarus americanus TaxID=6706 RepID=UPI001C48FACC|nr:protein NYNRIN-like [Homarus americanus]